MKAFNKYFDHTLLKPDASQDQIMRILAEASAYDFASVCVNGCYVSAAAEYLQNTHVKVACVVGFPLGAQTIDAKAGEARIAIADGAEELDMVMNIGAAKDGRWDYVRREIRTLAQICHRSADGQGTVLLKVILETCLLTDQEIRLACQMARKAGADFVKTSTGFSSGGADPRHIRLMREAVGGDVQIKASGGIRTLKDARAMIDAGADRLGCSASVQIMEEYLAETEGETPAAGAQPVSQQAEY